MTRYGSSSRLDLNIPPPPASPTSNLNNLSPAPSNDSPFYTNLHWLFHAVIPFLTPALIAFVKMKTEDEKEEIHKAYAIQMQRVTAEHRSQVQELQVKLSAMEPSAAAGALSPAQWLDTLDTITGEEERAVTQREQVLESVRPGLQRVLDYRCSRLNPAKPREERVRLQHALLKSTYDSPTLRALRMYDGLVDIYDHDHRHCATAGWGPGAGREANGRLYRVYMQLWRQQLQVQKYEAIISRLRTTVAEGGGLQSATHPARRIWDKKKQA